MASTDREFSIVVFGASGFTGQFVVREVARNCKGKFKWAVAGRSKDKLISLLEAQTPSNNTLFKEKQKLRIT